MSDARLKEEIIDALWRVVDRHACILSATLTGSFVNSDSLTGLSDIDFVVVVDRLNQARFDELQGEFQESVEPVLEQAGYTFRLNPTLGPLKFNAPRLAVLHLMFYSHEAHVNHVIQSPFTCLDWQTSPCFRKLSLGQIYPSFGLQPRHFLSARRSIGDYLKDFRARVVSYRELVCDPDGYREVKRDKPMDNRDRHEFAYHVMRFLMLNLIKLVDRKNVSTYELGLLMDHFFELFPAGESDARALLLALADRKRRIDFAGAVEGLDRRLETFVELFEEQFRDEFMRTASQHLAFRHAATPLNKPPIRFLGRSDPSILPSTPDEQLNWQGLEDSIARLRPNRRYVSPLVRCLESLRQVCPGQPDVISDDRLVEINYGSLEQLAINDGREQYPHLFNAWKRGEDPRFPGGENSADVLLRVQEFASESWKHDAGNSVTCTHNVVLRELVGATLGVPPAQRFRIQIPHMTPISFVVTKRFGLFVELDETVERELFRSFAEMEPASREQPRVERHLACKS